MSRAEGVAPAEGARVVTSQIVKINARRWWVVVSVDGVPGAPRRFPSKREAVAYAKDITARSQYCHNLQVRA